MNIPFNAEPMYNGTNTRQGNSGIGSNINKPTIPRIDYSPNNEWVTGDYNNNEQPTALSTLYSNDSNVTYYQSNNPIDGVSWINNKGLSGHGGNRGNHYGPNQWSPYTLIQNTDTPEVTQTFPYNDNSQFIQGSTRRAWNDYESMNINSVQGGLEQIPPMKETVPMERTPEEIEEDEAIKKLMYEMD
jgi:hypothetical protein